MSKAFLISGGAAGADTLFGEAAQETGRFEQIHYSFPGHKANVPERLLVRLSDEKLREANKRCALAAPSLERVWPPKHTYTRKLLQRNWWQVRVTPSLYAVAPLSENGIVAGGTAWAVQMYIDRHVPGTDLRLYLFDLNKSCWMQRKAAGWERIKKPPRPEETHTGIGSREQTTQGQEAIRGLYV